MKKNLLIVWLLLIIASCTEDENLGQESINRTIIVYMAADNDLYADASADALPVKFNFILMDACLMGSVEVAYELKDKTDYLIASSTETIYTGFPYDRIIPELLKPQLNLKTVAQNYYDYYNSLQQSPFQILN